jgi:hypothetical protein
MEKEIFELPTCNHDSHAKSASVEKNQICRMLKHFNYFSSYESLINKKLKLTLETEKYSILKIDLNRGNFLENDNIQYDRYRPTKCESLRIVNIEIWKPRTFLV